MHWAGWSWGHANTPIMSGRLMFTKGDRRKRRPADWWFSSHSCWGSRNSSRFSGEEIPDDNISMYHSDNNVPLIRLITSAHRYTSLWHLLIRILYLRRLCLVQYTAQLLPGHDSWCFRTLTVASTTTKLMYLVLFWVMVNASRLFLYRRRWYDDISCLGVGPVVR